MSHDDLLETRPALRSDLTVRAVGSGASRRVRLADLVAHRSHDLGWTEYEFVSLLDGRSTLREAVATFSRYRPRVAFSTADAVRIAQWLSEAGLLTGERPAVLRPAAARFNPFSLHWPVFRGDHWANSLVPFLGWLFTGAGFVVWLAVIVCSAVVAGPRLDRFPASIADWFVPSNWLGLAVLWTLLKVWHELGHAVAAARAGAPPREAGVTLMYFAPLAYVDLSDTWRVSSRADRIITSLAGVYVELFVAAIALLGWSQTSDPVLSWWLANTVLLAGVNTLLFNLNPLARLDGYFALVDLLEQPNLGPRGRADLHRRAVRFLCGMEAEAWVGLPRESWAVCLFAFASQIWTACVLVSVMVGLARAWSGAGLVVALLGGLVLVGPLVAGLMRGLSRTLLRSPKAFGRAAGIVLSTGAAVAGALWVTPVSWRSTAACIVEFDEGAPLRAPDDAFVDRVCVPAGATVQAGELVVVLRSDALTADYEEALAKLAICRMRDHLAVERQDLAAARIFSRETEAALASAERLERRLAALKLRAPRSGVVVAEGLSDRPGTFVPAGTELLLVGDPSRKRLTVLVAEADAPALQDMTRCQTGVRSATASFRMVSGRSGSAEVTRFEPRATTTLAHPALAATHGGPLAVKPVSEGGRDRLELTAAHTVLTCFLDGPTSQHLELGETGQIRLATERRTLAELAAANLADWFRGHSRSRD